MSCSASPSSRFRMSLFQLMQLCRKGVWLAGGRDTRGQRNRIGGWEDRDGERDRDRETGRQKWEHRDWETVTGKWGDEKVGRETDKGREWG